MTTPDAQSPAWQPPQPRPPLSPRLKRSASVAGAVSFSVISLGFGLFAFAAAAGLFASFFGFILDIVGRTAGVRDAEFVRITEFFDQLNPAAWAIPLVIAGVLGLLIMALGLFLSAGMLRRGGHPSPWPTTWAGWSVAVVGSSLVSWVSWMPGQLLSFAQPQSDNVGEAIGASIAIGTVGAVLSLVLNAVIGWLAWWWMAHAMRPAEYRP